MRFAPFLVLQGVQAIARFDTRFVPPLDLGTICLILSGVSFRAAVAALPAPFFQQVFACLVARERALLVLDARDFGIL